MEVENPEEVERLLHQAFDGHRVRHSREFFDCSPQEVAAAIRLTGGRDVTPTDDVVEDEDSRRALEPAQTRRDAFNFEMVGLKLGTEIYFGASADEEPTITARVSSRNRIIFEGEEASLEGRSSSTWGWSARSKSPGSTPAEPISLVRGSANECTPLVPGQTVILDEFHVE